MTTKDILDITIIPITLALIALLWPAIQSWNRQRAFRRLIVRELEEISPHPPEPTLSGRREHRQKKFIHQRIFDDPTGNRDFILSPEPDLVSYVTQLWQALDQRNWVQWDYCLACLSARRWDKQGCIATARER